MVYYKDLNWELQRSFNNLGLSVEACVDELKLLAQAIKANIRLMRYLRNKSRAYKRSVRNQQNPIHSKKCKHGRQQRTRRRK